MKIIGMVGYKGSGKTTITASVCNIDNTIQQMNFSSPIVSMLIAFGVPGSMIFDKKQWDTPLNMLCGRTIRHAVQTLGTEWGRRTIGEDVWLLSGLRRAQVVGGTVIFDDVRFPNEFDAIRQSGGTLLAIVRPGLAVDLSHESEQHIAALQARCDYTIVNDGSVETAAKKMLDTVRNTY